MSGFGLSIEVQGIQEAQELNRRDIEALQPAREFGRALQYAALYLFDYAVAITHRRTGALAAALRVKVILRPYGWRLFVDPYAQGPKGRFPADYGFWENARGGDHAFMDRTFTEAGDRATEFAVDFLSARIV